MHLRLTICHLLGKSARQMLAKHRYVVSNLAFYKGLNMEKFIYYFAWSVLAMLAITLTGGWAYFIYLVGGYA